MSKPAIHLLSLILVLLLPTIQAADIGETLDEAGTRVEMPDGSLMQMAINDKKIIVHFLDKEGKVIESPAASIVLVVDDVHSHNDEFRTIIQPAGDASLASARIIFPPYNFRARVIIRFTDGTTKTFPNLSLDLAKGSE